MKVYLEPVPKLVVNIDKTSRRPENKLNEFLTELWALKETNETYC